MSDSKRSVVADPYTRHLGVLYRAGHDVDELAAEADINERTMDSLVFGEREFVTELTANKLDAFFERWQAELARCAAAEDHHVYQTGGWR